MLQTFWESYCGQTSFSEWTGPLSSDHSLRIPTGTEVRVKESSQVQSEKWLTLFGLDLERSFDRYTFGFPKGIHATENPIRHR